MSIPFPPSTVERISKAVVENMRLWKHLSLCPRNLTFKPLHGGMTNAMLMATIDEKIDVEGAPRHCLVRVINMNVSIDRVREDRVLQEIDGQEIGPRIWATVAIDIPVDGTDEAKRMYLRLEEYIPGDTLVVEDLHTIAIGRQMAHVLYSFNLQKPNLQNTLSGLKAGMHTSLSAASLSSLASLQSVSSRKGAPVPTFRRTLLQYLSDISRIRDRLDMHPSQEVGREFFSRKRPNRNLHLNVEAVEPSEAFQALMAVDWADEVDFISGLMEIAGGPVVLCHGDAQPGNWILASPDYIPTKTPLKGTDEHGKPLAKMHPDAPTHSAGRRLVLLDFEYAEYSPRGFDLGNLSCEHCADYNVSDHPGFAWYPNRYPSFEWQLAFFTAYAEPEFEGSEDLLPEVPPTDIISSLPARTDPEIWLRTTLKESIIASHFPKAIQSLVQETRCGILASNLGWALWGIVMAANPEPSGHSIFDYKVYGAARALEYFRLKSQLQHDNPTLYEASRVAGSIFKSRGSGLK